MKIHLVSGFLGSGKTTAIANAAKQLNDQDLISGVITNDQGKYLVDSKFMDLTGIASTEVTGSCFCCNFNQLEKQIQILRDTVHPDVIFAESVGSCTDLVATVVKPLARFHPDDVEEITFSGFVDARLLHQHLEGQTLPFTPETNYIWEKQIEEAEILVVNKIDLLQPSESERLKESTHRVYPHKVILFQNSLDMESIRSWTSLLSSYHAPQKRTSIEVDYQKYGKGEADLAWLDEEITFISSVDDTAVVAAEFIEQLVQRIHRQRYPIGHLKFLISNGSGSMKLSYTAVVNRTARVTLPFRNADHLTVGINARIQTTPETLRNLLLETIDQLRNRDFLSIEEKNVSYFRPGFPEPTYRFTNYTVV